MSRHRAPQKSFDAIGVKSDNSCIFVQGLRMIEITFSQRMALYFIADYIADHGYSPAMSEVASAMGSVNPNTGKSYVDALERKSYINRDRGVPRSITLTDLGKRTVANDRKL